MTVHHSSDHLDDTLPTENYGTHPKTLTAYIIGFVLSLLLSVAAFVLVGKHLLNTRDLYISISVLALLQFIVQTVCFLRLNADPEGRWNLYPFIFAIFVVVVLAGGSLWIMYNLNLNMAM